MRVYNPFNDEPHWSDPPTFEAGATWTRTRKCEFVVRRGVPSDGESVSNGGISSHNNVPQ